MALLMPFEKEEYLARMKKVKDSMSSRGIDVLLVTDPANMCYLAGYNAWSFYVHQVLVVTLDDEQPTFIGRYMDAFCGALKTTWLDASHVRWYSDDYVQNTEKHPFDFVAGVLKDMGAGKKTIAVEMDSYYFTATCYESLKNGLPEAKIVNGNLLVNWVRIIKSPKEIELMKRAAKIVEKAMQTAIESLEPGSRQCDVAANIYNSLIKGTDEFGGDYPSIVPLLPSGDTSGAPHLTWTDERYSTGTIVMIEIAGCHQRYHSPMARTVSIGKPDDKVKRVAEITVEGLNAALNTVKPGVTCEEVELAWRKVLKKYGFEKESRIGYSMGLNYPPDWGEHTASLRPGDKTVLQPNMTFHCIPGMYFDDFGVSISEAFRVTENGCETLANFPRQLFIK
ncbi:Peptidase M24, structural domain [Moorella glycerini]|uniref:Peptidase n=2 Tax=Neomoorella stamsii TaxID=1266720 RepID=A0A9X7J0Y8_9FIRM|nr:MULTISPECIES: M24 family metallopeptidase [Moorella]PRR68864.1 putative peptidase [Moorella stamsii]CEP67485.1 Peptidase M24, structural domain [Moorella glycerini]